MLAGHHTSVSVSHDNLHCLYTIAFRKLKVNESPCSLTHLVLVNVTNIHRYKFSTLSFVSLISPMSCHHDVLNSLFNFHFLSFPIIVFSYPLLCTLLSSPLSFALLLCSLLLLLLLQSGQLNEYTERKEMSADVVCMSLGTVAPGEQRSRFLAVGLADNTVRIISLDPSVCPPTHTYTTYTCTFHHFLFLLRTLYSPAVCRRCPHYPSRCVW